MHYLGCIVGLGWQHTIIALSWEMGQLLIEVLDCLSFV